MLTKDVFSALQKVTLALGEVQACSPETFQSVVKAYAGTSIPESDLIAVIDALAPLFDDVPFEWK